RAPEACLVRPAKHVGTARLGEVGRAVGTAVVDDEHVRVGRGGAQPFEDALDVVGLLVGRDDDQGGGHGQWTSSSRWARPPARTQTTKTIVGMMRNAWFIVCSDAPSSDASRCWKWKWPAISTTRKTTGAGPS